MRKRDAAIVVLSFFGLLLSLGNEGAISFRKAWYHSTARQGEQLAEFEAQETLPPPVVVDLNGDGALEVAAVTRDYALELLKPRPPGRAGEGFAAAEVIASVSLLPSAKVSIGLDRRPVALAAGYLDAPPRERVRAPRKQVLVVVTAAWHVMCFDHNLALMWEGSADGGGGGGDGSDGSGSGSGGDGSGASGGGRRAARPHEVAVIILPRRVRAGDRGLVIVGGDAVAASAAAGAVAAAAADAAAGGGGAGGASTLQAALAEEAAWEAAALGVRGGGASNAAPGAVAAPGGAVGAGADTTRHFDYAAFEGATGEPRWAHRAGAFRGDGDLAAAAAELTPQHSPKLDAEHLAARHYGELACRDFRESVLRALPHLWASPADTRLEEAAFVRHREGGGARKHDLARRAAAARSAGGSGSGGSGGGHRSRSRTSAAAAWLLGGSARRAQMAAAAKRRGGGSGKGGAEAAAAAHGALAANASAANALVAHLEGGLEAVHLYTGRTLCALHLPAGQLHADVNGDGVIDHIALAGVGGGGGGGADAPLHHVQTAAHTALGACALRATSGVPPSEELWVADVCGRRAALDDALFPGGGGGGDGGFAPAGHGAGGGGDLAFAPPAFLPVPRADGTYSRLRGQHGIVAVLGSDGVVTALSARGERLWQRFLEVGWDAGLTPGVAPSLAPLALRRGAVPAALLAVGADAAVAVSEHGAELARLALAHAPVAAPVAADFDGDGLTDLVFVTPVGLFGYAQVQHLGGLSFGTLLAVLMVAMAAVWWGQAQGNDFADARARKLRSTDVD